jgi:hypothetical protein
MFLSGEHYLAYSRSWVWFPASQNKQKKKKIIVQMARDERKS